MSDHNSIEHDTLMMQVASMNSFGEIHSHTSFDGWCFPVRYFPAASAERRIVFLHGIISHSGWYESSSQAFAELGNEVHFLDRRGSGLDTSARGDIDRWQTWVDDVVHYLESLPDGPPVLLVGISWGGKLAPVVARQRPDLLAGVGMLCPGVYARQQPGLAKRLAVHSANEIGAKTKRVAIPLRQSHLFTDSPTWQNFIDNDPLTLRDITMRFAKQDHQLTIEARRSGPFIHKPALLAIAGRDKIVDNKKTVEYHRSFASTSKTLLEYPGAAHTLEFEPEPGAIIEDVSAWAETTAHRAS